MQYRLTSAILGCLFTASLVSAGAKGSVVLATFDEHNFGGAYPCNQLRAQFFLEHDSQEFTHIVTLGKNMRFWQNGETGQFDFTPGNSEPTFGEFSQLVTDGQDDYIVSLGYTCGGGGGLGYLESTMLGGNPDLAGSQLDFARLIVHDLVVERFLSPYGGIGVEFDAHITYEFWGSPVPEPSAFAVLLVIAQWVGRAPRCRRPSLRARNSNVPDSA